MRTLAELIMKGSSFLECLIAVLKHFSSQDEIIIGMSSVDSGPGTRLWGEDEES